MGQLESYTIHDIFLVAILSGVLSTYFAEEIEATIESVAAYVYSGNLFTRKKKIVRIAINEVSAGDITESRYASFNFLGILASPFMPVDRTLESRQLWQDTFIAK